MLNDYPTWIASTDPSVKKGSAVFVIQNFRSDCEKSIAIELSSFEDYLKLNKCIDYLCYKSVRHREQEIIGNLSLNIGKLIG